MTDLLALTRDALCDAIPDLTRDVNCYVSAVSVLVEQGSPFQVQVIDGGGKEIVDPGGNCLGIEYTVKVSIFVHFAFDRSQHTQEVLIRDSEGLRARREQVLAALVGSYLDDQLDVALRYRRHSEPLRHPVDRTWVSQDVYFSGHVYGLVEG